MESIATLRELVACLRIREAHHGSCIGADALFHKIILESPGTARIVVHQPKDAKAQACCLPSANGLHPVEYLKPKEYLLRNKGIVDASDVLIAMPKESKEVLRSGTWATIRYARKQGKPIIFIMPNVELPVSVGYWVETQ